MSEAEKLLSKNEFSRNDIIVLLQANEKDSRNLFLKAQEIKQKHANQKALFRGLIEISNICHRNCLHCCYRVDNNNVIRFNLSDEEILEAAVSSWQNNIANIAIQSGEIDNPLFTARITNLLKKIKIATSGELGIMLSMGEHSEETYKTWFENGVTRYFLRINSSNRELFEKLHLQYKNHSYDSRIKSLASLREIGYSIGTSITVGLPFQTLENLADDLLWMKDMRFDMVEMIPYFEHSDTPLYRDRSNILPLKERFNLSLKMVAILRIMMEDINIIAPAALQTIDSYFYEKCLNSGANVELPNITPGFYRNDYKLYDTHYAADAANNSKRYLDARVQLGGDPSNCSEHCKSTDYFTNSKTGS